MVNINELVKKIRKSGFTEEKMADLLDGDREVFLDKLKNCDNCFTIKEAKELVKILGLEGAEASKIFLLICRAECD